MLAADGRPRACSGSRRLSRSGSRWVGGKQEGPARRFKGNLRKKLIRNVGSAGEENVRPPVVEHRERQEGQGGTRTGMHPGEQLQLVDTRRRRRNMRGEDVRSEAT